MRRIDRGRVGNVLGIIWAVLTIMFVAAAAKCEEFRILAHPRVTHRGNQVHLRVTVEDGNTCYSIRWIWPDGTESFNESDCDSNDIPKFQSWNKYIALPTGEWDIHANVELSKKVVKKLSVTIHVN